MNKSHKSNEELLQELQELKAENASLKAAYLNDIAEIKRIENNLRVSEEKYRLLFENLTNGFSIHEVITDENGEPFDFRCIEVNNYFKEISGFKPEEVKGKTIKEILPDSDINMIKKYCDVGITGIPFVDEYYSNTFKKHIKVNCYSPKKGFFAVIYEDISERKQTEEALKYERQRLASILEGTNVGTWEWNIQTGETVFNERWAGIIGYKLEEISPVSIETWMKFAHPDDLKVSGELLQRHFNGELDYYDFESRMKHKNGEWIWIYDRGKVHQWDENGNPLLMSGTHLDITERKRIEWTLRESEEKYRKIFDNVQGVFFQSDIEGRLIEISPSIERYTGFTREYLLNQPVQNVYQNPDERIKLLSKLQDKGEVTDYELYLKNIYGESVIASLNAHLLKNSDNIIIGMEGSLRDISERKQAEEELFQSTQHLKAVYDIIGTGIILINSENQTILDVNKAASELIGLPPNDIIGKVCQKFICPNEIGHCPVKDLHKEVENCERKLVNYNGEQKDIIKTVYPIKYKGMDCYLESFMDITELKMQEKELKRVNDDLRETQELIEDNLFQKNALIEELSETKEKLEQINSEKDKFFSIIAHDLRSPFSGFLGLTKMMAEEINDLSMKELQELTRALQESAGNLYKLLDNLLEWSRMQRGMTKFYPEICPLAFIAKEVLEIQSEVAKAKEIELFNRIPDGITITADISMLNTVLRNLISNALKFTPRGGKIEIGVDSQPSEGLKPSEGSTHSDGSVVYIKDSGIGMTAETISKLFKLDENVSQKGTEGEPSTGLGLLLCKDFIEKHGGRIWVESEFGRGSTFYFTIPYDK